MACKDEDKQTLCCDTIKNTCTGETNAEDITIPRQADASYNDGGCCANTDRCTRIECDTECLLAIAELECQKICGGRHRTSIANDPKACAEACCSASRSKEASVIEEGCATGSRESTGKLAIETDPCVKACCTFDDNCKDEAEGSYFFGASLTHPVKDACDTHLQKAMDEFAAYIEKGLCICRSVLDRYGGETCCSRRQAVAVGVNKGRNGTKRRKVAMTSAPANSPGIGEVEPEGWCSGSEKSSIKRRAMEVRCGLDDTVLPPSRLPTRSNVERDVVDVEARAARQHVLVSVSGMTCSGCSRKVDNILSRTAGVSAHRTTFVNGMCEFDIDTEIISKELVIDKLKKESGFKCSSIESDFQILELVLDPGTATRLQDGLPRGVEWIKALSKTTYSLSYDPIVVGARDLLGGIPGARLAPPSGDASLADGRKRLKDMAWSTFAATIMTVPVLGLNWSDNPVSHSTRLIVSLFLATCVQGIAVPEFYIGAVQSLVYSRVVEMDMLVVISITAAYGYSVVAAALSWSGYTLEIEAFFETSSLLITLVLFGRLMAALARVSAVSAVTLRSLQAEKALLVQSHGGYAEIDARLLQTGDVFVVAPHSRIVTDGVIVQGYSSIDESRITGESIPVPKGTGDVVIAGTINGPSNLSVRLTRLPGKNSITDIANLVENALSAKPRAQDLADKVARWFVPAVIGISLIVFVIWVVVCLKIRDNTGGGAVGMAISYGIAVLAVSCPCALGLAVPMVLVVAGGLAAQSGIIIKQADAIEKSCKVTDVVFDKTGTLTNGTLEVHSSQIFENNAAAPAEVAALATALTKGNEHPVSRAVNSAIGDTETIVELENVRSIPGSGITGTYKGHVIKAGNPFWLDIDSHPEVISQLDQGMTIFCLAVDSELVAFYSLKSTTRPEAKHIISSLLSRNITCHIVSGDTPRVVDNIATEIGVSSDTIVSRCSPADKQKYVEQLMQQGKTVLFCGDGTNDAVAVAQANIGVQIGSTSDVTRATADVILLGGLDGIPALLNLSRRALRRITFNFVWSAVYNLFAILLAAGAFVKIRIPPAYAGLGEIVSIAPVIVAALTLMRKEKVAVE